MDRFKILKEKDPFEDMPRGDTRKYKFMRMNHLGWEIDEHRIIVDMNKNAFSFLSSLKEIIFEISTKDGSKIEEFKVEKIFNKILHKNKKQETRFKVHFEGKYISVKTPNYILNK